MFDYMFCINCGSEFNADLSGPYGECPHCGSENTTIAEECHICGEFRPEGESKARWICDECLDKYLNPENFLRFAMAEKGWSSRPDVLEDFIMYEVFEVSTPITESSIEFKEHCVSIYNDLVKAGKAMDLINSYLGEGYEIGYPEFGEWVADELKKGGELIGGDVKAE